MSLLMGSKLGGVLRWLRGNWGICLAYASIPFMFSGFARIGLILYIAGMLGMGVGRALWRWLIFSPPIWAIRWKLRPVWRRLHWIFGKKWYWVYSGGIVKVVVTERDPAHNMWSFMENRQWDDGTKSLNRFSSGTSCAFPNVQDAVKYLVSIQKRELDSCKEFWKNREAEKKAELLTKGITETTAIRLFSCVYSNIQDRYTDNWNGILGSEFDIKALQNVWLSLSYTGKKELHDWANEYTNDRNFANLVEFMEK